MLSRHSLSVSIQGMTSTNFILVTGEKMSSQKCFSSFFLQKLESVVMDILEVFEAIIDQLAFLDQVPLNIS